MPAHGRYTVVRKIADGGMAEIFLGKQHGAEGFERPVVLKRILTAFYADPQFRNLLIDEAHVAMSLLHSNIVQVVDLGQSSGRYFLVMELVDGWDLNQLLHRARAAAVPFPPELALYVCAEVCRGLHYAHSRTRDGKTLGIVHRDVSPHNVLLSDQGEVKLTDFGIAKALGKRDRTGTGVIKGKLAFMSPEQASGAVLDRRSDSFSVGTMLYVMACGRKPFEAPTDLESMLRVQKADFPTPETVTPAIAAPLAAAIKRAMRLLPSERYQSAEEMLEDLERVQRAAFPPAGQTELKRWLADLGKKDGISPITRQAPPARGPDGAGGAVDSVDGLDVVLEEPGNDGVGATVSLSTPAPVAIEPPPAMPSREASVSRSTRADAPGSRSRSNPAVVAATSPAAARRGLRVAITIAIVAAAAVAGAAWVASRDSGGPRIAIGPAVPTAVPTARGDGEGAGGSTFASPTARATPPPVAVERPAPIAPAESTGDAGGTDGAPVPSAAADEEPGEEELLRQAEKGAAEKILGEEEGESTGGEKTERAKVADRRKEGAPGVDTVTVKLSSKPDGAVVRVGRKVLGRTPLAPRFRSGISYDVSFLKTGYVTRVLRVKVVAKKKQALAVVLKKKPAAAKPKGLLQRIFPASADRGKR